jgi:hypothetical protein
VSINNFSTNNVMTTGIQTNNPAIKYLRMRDRALGKKFRSTKASRPAMKSRRQPESLPVKE